MTSKARPAARSTRAPMGEKAHDTHRASRGRTGTATTPVVIRGSISRDGTLDQAAIRASLGQKLGKYARRIDRVDVSLSSRTPAKGAAAAEITISVKADRTEPVAVTADGASVRAAFTAAVRNVERALRRGIERKRRTARAQGR